MLFGKIWSSVSYWYLFCMTCLNNCCFGNIVDEFTAFKLGVQLNVSTNTIRQKNKIYDYALEYP